MLAVILVSVGFKIGSFLVGAVALVVAGGFLGYKYGASVAHKAAAAASVVSDVAKKV